MFGFKKKRIGFDELPADVQEQMSMLEVVMMEGGDALGIVSRIAKKYPGFVEGRLNLATLQLREGSRAYARTTYEKVLDDFPDELGAIAGLATIFAEEQKYDDAEAYARKALDGGYQWSVCYGVIAEAREQAGDPESAAQYYLDGYRLSPHSWNYLEHYCRLKGRAYTPPLEDVEPFITMQQLDELINFIDRTANTPDASGSAPGCDHTLRFAERWAAENDVDVIELYQFVNRHGGFCDCEICFNVSNLLEAADE
ncbi:MAG: DUF2695 domain-containing protein [Woeseiaceae bacterium]|nr:DUF2695 domain-containing protein [Woeseiaceae bacterium]